LLIGKEYVNLVSNDGITFTVKADVLKISPFFQRMLDHNSIFREKNKVWTWNGT
jgi:hypothetical protein